MLISNELADQQTDKLVLEQDAVVQAPEIAACLMAVVAVWSEVEAKVEGIFANLVGDDELALDAFRDLRGWDRREKALKAAASTLNDNRVADVILSAVRQVSSLSEMRNEVAHGLWAAVEGKNDRLAILDTAVMGMIADLSSGRVSTEESFRKIYGCAWIVRIENVQSIQDKIGSAAGLINDAYLISFGSDRDVTGNGFEDVKIKMEGEPELASRINNMRRDREKKQRQAAKLAKAEMEKSSAITSSNE
ncbi:hypothetical protein QE419_000776 [Brevundimonas vesicularis]|uniref:hypothetical protein n=1 Tax=Brevundimonas vesicularis TaxID=41276 RepID=UPI00278BABFF|nr:hypothetical protein [Brevundimonas vesicularis]MDQ1192010.1 hypothetical protein [Brevundimonas vesicularis]